MDRNYSNCDYNLTSISISVRPNFECPSMNQYRTINNKTLQVFNIFMYGNFYFYKKILLNTFLFYNFINTQTDNIILHDVLYYSCY